MTDDKKPRDRAGADGAGEQDKAAPGAGKAGAGEAAHDKTASQGAPENQASERQAPEGQAAPGGSKWGGQGDTGGDPAADPADSDPAARVAELEAEKAELRDQLLRALADVENTRRRLQRELDEKMKYATAPLAKDLLGVADNLGRALGAVPAEVREQEAVKSLIAGVEMTEKALMEAFAKHGIERIEPAGEKLDPHRHEAMMEIQDPSKPAGTVAQVFEAGYELRGRLLRPARVAVAKGGPAPGGEAAEPGSTVDTKA